jgi:hypothetical protein
VQGSPSRAVSQVKGDNLHFVPIPYSGPLQSDYLPSALKAEDDTRQKFDAFMAAQACDTGGQATRTAEDDTALYPQFLKWKESQPGARR